MNLVDAFARNRSPLRWLCRHCDVAWLSITSRCWVCGRATDRTCADKGVFRGVTLSELLKGEL